MSDELGQNIPPPTVKARMDWFLADTVPVEIEISDEIRAHLVDQAGAFIRANGHMAWDKWSLLSDVSRVVFLEAFEKLRQG